LTGLVRVSDNAPFKLFVSPPKNEAAETETTCAVDRLIGFVLLLALPVGVPDRISWR
jgi:hypothetical protein